MLSEVFLGLGSNLGDRPRNIASAIDRLREVASGVVVSSLYETRPQGFAGQPSFVNAACRFWTCLDTFVLLKRLNEIQDAVGSRRTFVNGPRLLDIDMLIFGRTVLATPILTVPHPRMAEREFVLLPLAEIAPRLVHPVLKTDVRSLLLRLTTTGDVGTVVPLPGFVSF